MGSPRSIKETLLCECPHPPTHTRTHGQKRLVSTEARTRAGARTSSVEALRSANRLTNRGGKWVAHSCWSKRVFFLSSTLDSGLITMGAVWTALCLFLLLLNTRQSAALPHNAGKSSTLLLPMLCARLVWILCFFTCEKCMHHVKPLQMMYELNCIPWEFLLMCSCSKTQVMSHFSYT